MMTNASYVGSTEKQFNTFCLDAGSCLDQSIKRHDNTLKVLAVKWAIENGLLPEETKWYAVNWERGTVIENNRKKLDWDWEHRMRTKCIARRPDLTLEDSKENDTVN